MHHNPPPFHIEPRVVAQPIAHQSPVSDQESLPYPSILIPTGSYRMPIYQHRPSPISDDSLNVVASKRKHEPHKCGNCGQAGHTIKFCKNQPNPDLVEANRKTKEESKYEKKKAKRAEKKNN